jgi:hypothetical protein
MDSGTEAERAAEGAGIDVAGVGGGLDRAAVPQALDDEDDGRLGELGGSQEGALPLGEATLAGRAIRPADLLVLAGPLADREVGGVGAVEVGAVGVGAGEAGEWTGRLDIAG